MNSNFTVEKTPSVLPHFTAVVVIMHFVCVLHFRCSVSSTDGMHTSFAVGCKLYANAVHVPVLQSDSKLFLGFLLVGHGNLTII
jgi:hypothetical protein